MNTVNNTNKKKKITAVLSVIMVAVLVIGATLAYLSNMTNDKENVFTFADNVTAELEEPNWDPEDALEVIPGKEVLKDPLLLNTSENNVDEYVSIKIAFLDGKKNLVDDEKKRDINGNEDEKGMTDMERLLSLIEIDWSSMWTLKDGTATSAEQIYVYNEVLAAGEKTVPVFYSVTIKNISSEDQKWLAGNFGHTDSCYVFGTHVDTCTVTYRHHEKCAVAGEADAGETGLGETVNGKTCNCKNVVSVHDSKCPAAIKTLSGKCAHKDMVSGLGGFIIKVQGSVVQADAFDGPFGSESGKTYASDALIELYS